MYVLIMKNSEQVTIVYIFSYFHRGKLSQGRVGPAKKSEALQWCLLNSQHAAGPSGDDGSIHPNLRGNTSPTVERKLVVS